MVALLILIILALTIGVGAVVEGILWLLFITLIVVLAAGWAAWGRMKSLGGGQVGVGSAGRLSGPRRRIGRPRP